MAGPVGTKFGIQIHLGTGSIIVKDKVKGEPNALGVSRVYFRTLKKGVVLPLATVKRGRVTP